MNGEKKMEEGCEKNMNTFENINVNEMINDIINKLMKGVTYYNEDMYGNKTTGLYTIPNIAFNEFTTIINCNHTISKHSSKESFYGCHVYLYHKTTPLCIKVLYDIAQKQIVSIVTSDFSGFIFTISNIQSS